jgi:CRISPR-associated protein Cas2
MSQFSVYVKFCGGKERADALEKRIESASLPQARLLRYTDKQYAGITCFTGKTGQAQKGSFQLF